MTDQYTFEQLIAECEALLQGREFTNLPYGYFGWGAWAAYAAEII